MFAKNRERPFSQLSPCLFSKQSGYLHDMKNMPIFNNIPSDKQPCRIHLRLRDCAMGANSTASTRLLNPHGTPRCSVCLQYLEKLKTDGHKKIKEITCDSADLKKDSLEKDEVAFLVLVKYSNTASFPPVCLLCSLSE